MKNNGENTFIKFLEQAKEYYLKYGFCVFPASYKQPVVKWKKYLEKKQPPTLEEIEKWFKNPTQFKKIKENPSSLSISIATGSISGNLLVVDFESEGVFRKTNQKLVEYPRLYKKFATTLITKTKRGYHVYLRVKEKIEIKTKKISKLIEIRGENVTVVAPPGMHPDGVRYEFINKAKKIQELNHKEYKTLIKILEELEKEEKQEKKVKKEKKEKKEKKLSESEILNIVELLKPCYVKGYRDYIVFYLSGWLRKKNISYESAEKIIKLLCENDEEKENRIWVLKNRYGLEGSSYEIEKLKGYSGLQEILEEILGKEKGLITLKKLEEIIGISPYAKDSVFSLIDFNKKTYFLSNPTEGIIVRAKEKENTIEYHELICEFAITKAIKYENILGGLEKYEIEVVGKPNFHRVFGPANLNELKERLKLTGRVKNERLFKDALPSLITAFELKGKMEIKKEIEKPGFYFINEEIKNIKWEVENYSKEDLREALTFLKELREKWFNHLGPRFTTIIKWGIIAPFSFAMKQIHKTSGIYLPWLFLHGISKTGKTTVGKIVRAIWNLPLEEKGGSHINTEARLGHVISETTFPIVVNEVADIVEKTNIREMLKSAIESKTARGGYRGGLYLEEPSLASMIFTTNKKFPYDDAFLRRFVKIHFPPSFRVDDKRKEEFDNKVLPNINKLRFLGYFIFENIRKNPEILKKYWHEISTILLIKAFEYSELDIPNWINEYYSEESLEDMESNIIEEIRAKILDNINQNFSNYSRFYKNKEPTTVEERLRKLVENQFLPWAHLRGNDIIITNLIIKDVLKNYITDLKSLADYIGNSEYYSVVKLNKKSVKAIRLPFEKFVEFLTESENEETNKTEFTHIEPHLGICSYCGEKRLLQYKDSEGGHLCEECYECERNN